MFQAAFLKKMNKIRKICVVTGSRAEYDLLYLTMSEIEKSNNLKLQILVTGMHLSDEFGLTYKQIEQDGFNIDSKVDMGLISDTEIGIIESITKGMSGFVEALEGLKPDLLLVLGDRYEILSVAIVATILRIPIAHLHGGEKTEGAFDEPFRHSITKMSHLHFTSTDEYRKRVIQLGEEPSNVFNVGALAIDNIKKQKLLSKEEFENSIEFKLNKQNLLITFHPVTLENRTAGEQFSNLLIALDKLKNTHLIFTKTNSDTHGSIINQMIDNYVEKHSDKARAYNSLGRLRYLSAMQHVNGLVGNSSSGLIEAPYFNIGTVNVGDRQRGRIMTDSVINCDSTAEDISKAIQKLFNSSFAKKIDNMEKPYGNGGSAKSIVKIIASTSINGILKKQFFDINFCNE